MNPELIRTIVTVILSFIPFVLVGGWLIYRQSKSGSSLIRHRRGVQRRIKVGDTIYSVKQKSRIVAIEKKSGKEVIVTTCGFENEQQQLEGDIKDLPEGVKVRYKLDNGIFSPAESDWLAGDNFEFSGVTQVEEYEQQ